MGSRLELDTELRRFSENVYYQPPSNIKMKYPCIVYNKNGKNRTYGNNKVYIVRQGYHIMVIDRDPDSTTADDIESHFQYCSINQYYVVDNLNHTTLTLYY